MQDFHVKLITLVRHLEPGPEQRGQLLAETLLWPEASTFGGQEKQVLKQQGHVVEALARRGDPLEIHERQIPAEPEAGAVTFRLEPNPPSAAWNEPVEVLLPLVTWPHEGYRIAYLPELGIEVVAEGEADLARRVEEEARTALLRGGQGRNLLALALAQRTRRLDVVSSVVNLYPETPRERWVREEEDPSGGSELAKVAARLEPHKMPVAWHRDAVVGQLARCLSGRRAQSVLLVGAPGVGKTAVFQELVRRRTEFGFGERPFWRTSGSRIVSGMSGFGDWQERCVKVASEARGQGAVLHFGNLAELLEAGRAGGTSDNVAGFFRPRMVRGEILAVLECTPDQLAAVEKRDARVLDGLRQLRIEEPDAETSRRILEAAAAAWMQPGTPDPAALGRVDALHRRYAGYSAYPGKPLRFLQQLLRRGSGGVAEFTVARVNEAFSAETGLPLALLEDGVPLDLDRTRRWFGQRVMGQERAVGVVIDTVAMIKARLSRPGKPLASFLFVGPTGVGKTELAKCLAEFFYGSRERMIRLDMSEFNTPGSATRLVSDLGQEQEGLLTAQMRDQPFSVVLLDEFEKAHPAVFDLFLQVMGEARLTDGAGRVADFGNALVILTSNLGAEGFRSGVKLGFGGDTGSVDEAAAHFVAEAKKRFRPEFFNRIDHIVPFAPLQRDQLRGIIGKELEALQLRDGLRERRLRLNLDAEMIDRVLERGHDPRYGARPLRRQLGRDVLLPLAETLNQVVAREPGAVRVGAGEVTFAKESSGKGKPAQENLEWAADLRRKLQRLCRASFVSELGSERYRLQRAVGRRKRGRDEDEGARADRARLQAVGGLLGKLESLATSVALREEALLLRSVGQEPEEALDQGGPGAADYEELMFTLYAAAEKAPDRSTLVFLAEEHPHLFNVAEDYRSVAGRLGCAWRIGIFERKPRAEDRDEAGARVRPRILDAAEEAGSLAEREAGVLAVAVEFRGPLAGLWLRGEAGGHDFELDERGAKRKYRLQVLETDSALEECWFPSERIRIGVERGLAVHRRYQLVRGTWKDDRMGAAGNGFFGAELLEQIFRQRLHAMVERAL